MKIITLHHLFFSHCVNSSVNILDLSPKQSPPISHNELKKDGVQLSLSIVRLCHSWHLYMWCDQTKSVWSRSNSVLIFLTNCMHHFNSYIYQKTPLKLVNWFQRYEKLKDAKNNRKQKTFSALFGFILKSIFPTSDWFYLITSHMSMFPSLWTWHNSGIPMNPTILGLGLGLGLG